MRGKESWNPAEVLEQVWSFDTREENQPQHLRENACQTPIQIILGLMSKNSAGILKQSARIPRKILFQIFLHRSAQVHMKICGNTPLPAPPLPPKKIIHVNVANIKTKSNPNGRSWQILA